MSVTLTATADAGLGRVVLEWTATADVIALSRTDANGTRPVRTVDGVLPADSGVVEDYEVALLGDVTYVAETAAEADSDTVAMTGVDTWLSVPTAPANAVILDLVTGLESEQESMGTVHEVIGRADPLPVLGGLRARQGEIGLWCQDWAAAAAVARLHGHSAVMLLRQPDYAGLDLWYVPTSVRVQPSDDLTAVRRWVVSVGYREVLPQTGPLVGTLGRTYGDLVADHATYLAAAQTYDTYADVVTG